MSDTTTIDPDGVYSTGEAAELLGCSQMTIIRRCKDGLLKCFLLPGTRVRRITGANLLKIADCWDGRLHNHATTEGKRC